MSEIKITLHTDEILNEVKIAHRAIDIQKNVDFSEALILEFVPNEMIIKGTNGMVYFTAKVETGVNVTEEFAVNRDLFVSTLNAINKSEFTMIKNNDNLILEAYNDNGDTVFNSKLKFMNIENLPSFLNTNLEVNLDFDVDFLKDIFSQTFCISKNDNRPALKGVNLQKVGNQLLFISTDSNRLSRVALDGSGINSEDFSVILPNTLILEIKKISGGNVTFSFNAKNTAYIALKSDERAIIYPAIQGVFPEIDRLFPPKYTQRITVRGSEIKNLIESVAFIAKRNKNNLHCLKYNYEAKHVQVQAAHEEIGDVTNTLEEVEAQYEVDFNISLDNAYLKEAINAFKPEDMITFEFEGLLTIMYTEKNPNFKHLLMGVRTRSN